LVFATEAKFSKFSLLFRMSLPHQALFTNKLFFDKFGLFDVDNKFCMDYELLLRAYKNFPNVIMKDIFVSAWVEGGIGVNTLGVYKEYDNIKRKNKVSSNFILFLINKWILFKYYIKNLLK